MSFYYSLLRLRQKSFLESIDLLYAHGKVNPPNTVVWDSTKKCNLDCIHCGSEGNYGGELSTEEIKSIIDQLSSFGVEHFQITGGEPTLRTDFIDISTYAGKRGLKTSFASNGYSIDEDKAKSISKADVSLIQISIDGTEGIHNSIRKNPESFERAINAINLLKKHTNAKITASTIVMPQNIKSLPELKSILKSLKISFWNIGTVMPVGKAKNNQSLFLSGEQFRYLLQFIIDSRKDIRVELGENYPYLLRYDASVRKSPKFCPVGILYCCIGTDGHVRGCPDQPDTSFYREGDLKTETFEDIWRARFQRYRTRQIIKEDEKCSSCDNKADCFGGCWVMRERDLHCIFDVL